VKTRPLGVSVACVAMLGAVSARADDRDVIARAFHADAKNLVINLPPRPDTWPGAIFTANLRFSIKYGNSGDPALHRGQRIAITSAEGLDMSAEGGGGVKWLFSLSAKAASAAGFVLSFPDARVVEMTEGDLIQHIEAVEQAVDEARQGQRPLVVVRAYCGTPTMTFTKSAGASVDAWAALRAGLLDVAGKASADTQNQLVYKGEEEIVFAFETAEISTFVGPNSLNHVKIASVTSEKVITAWSGGTGLFVDAMSVQEVAPAAAPREPGEESPRKTADVSLPTNPATTRPSPQATAVATLPPGVCILSPRRCRLDLESPK